MKSNDSLFHLPFIIVLITLAIGATSLVNAGLNSGKTEQELMKLEQKFDGYTNGVKDSR